jgi:hypothetical protein
MFEIPPMEGFYPPAEEFHRAASSRSTLKVGEHIEREIFNGPQKVAERNRIDYRHILSQNF